MSIYNPEWSKKYYQKNKEKRKNRKCLKCGKDCYGFRCWDCFSKKGTPLSRIKIKK